MRMSVARCHMSCSSSSSIYQCHRNLLQGVPWHSSLTYRPTMCRRATSSNRWSRLPSSYKICKTSAGYTDVGQSEMADIYFDLLMKLADDLSGQFFAWWRIIWWWVSLSIYSVQNGKSLYKWEKSQKAAYESDVPYCKVIKPRSQLWEWWELTWSFVVNCNVVV